jgi:jumonji domain-containing protein 2
MKPIKNNTKSATKSKKARQKSAQNLSNEMENYIYSNPRTTAYRASSYRPTLEKFQSVAFADYVRAVLLGVTVDGVEPEDPYYSDDSDSDSDQTNEDKSDMNANENHKKDDVKDVDKNDDCKDGSEQNKKDITIKEKCSSVEKGNDESKDDNHKHCEKNNCVHNGDESDMKKDGFCGDETVTTSNCGDETKNPFPVKTINTEKSDKTAIVVATVPSSNGQEQCPLQSSAIINQHQEETTTMPQNKSSKQGKDSIDIISCSNTSNIPTDNTVKVKQEPTTSIRTTRSSTRRMTTRLQTKSIPAPSSPEKENIYSKPYYSTSMIREERQKKQQRRLLLQQQKQDKQKEEFAQQKQDKSCQQGLKNDHTKSKKRSKPSSSSSNSMSLPPPKPASKSVTPSPTKFGIPKPQKLELNSLKLSDGIAKITPPKGWWDYAGIGKDLTGRGKPWQTGTRLGDLVIPSPIKQCAAGIGGVYDFTMMELPSITVADFRKDADGYRKRQIGKEFEDDEQNLDDEQMDLLARKFWRRLGPTMESSKYGADMEGTLFDGDDACGWNVDKLESCLQLLLTDINNKDLDEFSREQITEEDFRMPGVTSAYLYFGMWASVFCAHTEDMNLLSINYLHAGAPKYWYAISPQDSGRFESLMASLFSHQSANCKEFLRHKRSLVSPSILTKAGIEYTTQVQRAGDIIITYPGSYHFGFNTGFNVAESTNFAVPEWIPLGDEARVCMCHPHSVRIEMKRFKSLLHNYDRDQIKNLQNGLPKMSYLEWARNDVKSKIAKRQKIRELEDKNNVRNVNNSRSSSKGVPVEVMKLMSGTLESGAINTQKQSKKRKTISSRKRKRKKNEKEDFRLAMKLKKSMLSQKKHISVLCLLECGKEYNYFAGNITAIVEDHARIHFAGTSKDDDIWMEVGSDMLFLDGGPCEKPE